MKKNIVVLDSQTVGEVTAGCAEVGEVVTVTLHDENGMPITDIGVVMEVM